MELGIEFKRTMEGFPWKIIYKNYMGGYFKRWQLGNHYAEMTLYYTGRYYQISEMTAYIYKEPGNREDIIFRIAQRLPTPEDLQSFTAIITRLTREHFNKLATP